MIVLDLAMYANFSEKSIDEAHYACYYNATNISHPSKTLIISVPWVFPGGKMSFLSFVKGMKIEENFPYNVTFRTSKSSGFLGLSLIFCGVGMGFETFFGHPIFSCFKLLSVFFLALAAFLSFVGIIIVTYRKCVIISKSQSKIEYMESSLFCWRRATYHFDEIQQIEICQIQECLINSRCALWAAKIYFRRGNRLETVKVFEGIESEKAEEAANILSRMVGRHVFHITRDFLSGNCPGRVVI